MEISSTHTKIQDTLLLLDKIGAFKNDESDNIKWIVTLHLKHIATCAISESRQMANALLSDFDHSISISEITSTSINIPPQK